MNPVLHGFAANPSLPPEAVDRLIALADADLADILACRPDLGRDRAVALAARVGDSAVRLAYEGRLTAADISPATHPQAALALLDRRAGRRCADGSQPTLSPAYGQTLPRTPRSTTT